MIICIPMGSSMAWEVVTQWTVLHHYCSTKFPFDPPTQSVTYIYIYIYHFAWVTSKAPAVVYN